MTPARHLYFRGVAAYKACHIKRIET